MKASFHLWCIYVRWSMYPTHNGPYGWQYLEHIVVFMDGFIWNPILMPMDKKNPKVKELLMDGKIRKSYTCLWMEKSRNQVGAYGWQYPEHITVGCTYLT